MVVISDARGRKAFAFVYCVCVCLRRGEITLSAWPNAAQSGGMMGVERPQNCCGYAHCVGVDNHLAPFRPNRLFA